MAPGTLNGQVVLVTGAARGIGAGAARALSARGARLSLVGLEPEELAAVAAQCGPGTLCFDADVTDAEAMCRAADETAERLGGIHAVVANAGIAAAGTMGEGDLAVFDRVMDVNVGGVLKTLRATLPHLRESKGYALVIASVASAVRMPGMGAYSASKAAVEAVARTMRQEVRQDGVDVGVAYFSWLKTDLVTGADEHPGARHAREKLPWPFSTTHSPQIAVDAIVSALERRSRHVTAPWWVPGLLFGREISARVGERDSKRYTEESLRLFQREVAERGSAAEMPVGAGGEASARAAGLTPPGD